MIVRHRSLKIKIGRGREKRKEEKAAKQFQILLLAHTDEKGGNRTPWSAVTQRRKRRNREKRGDVVRWPRGLDQDPSFRGRTR